MTREILMCDVNIISNDINNDINDNNDDNNV